MALCITPISAVWVRLDELSDGEAIGFAIQPMAQRVHDQCFDAWASL